MGALRALPCVVHGSDPGGGELPHPMQSHVLHAIHIKGNQWKSPGHNGVIQVRGYFSKAMARGRGME